MFKSKVKTRLQSGPITTTTWSAERVRQPDGFDTTPFIKNKKGNPIVATKLSTKSPCWHTLLRGDRGRCRRCVVRSEVS
jgi:hypothetical protein